MQQVKQDVTSRSIGMQRPVIRRSSYGQTAEHLVYHDR